MRYRRFAKRRQIHPVQRAHKAGIEAANFPFCTIEPNTGVVPMPDPRLDQLAEIVKPQRILPTTMEFVDIAGLVKAPLKVKVWVTSS